MLLRSSSSPILGSINPMIAQSESLKELEAESSLGRCKSAKPLCGSCVFGLGNRDLEAELHKSPPRSFKPAHKIAVVVDSLGSEKPTFSGRKNDVLRPGVGGEVAGSSPVARNSQSVSKTEDGPMYIAGGFGIGNVNHEVSRADSVSDCTEVYYQKMLEANPGNSLLLRNYAKFLHEVRINPSKQIFILIFFFGECYKLILGAFCC